MKLLAILIIFSVQSIPLQSSKTFNPQPYVRFTALKCWASNVTFAKYKCFIKAYSRNNSTFNIVGSIKRPLFSLNVSYDLRYKYLTNSQRSIINMTSELCQFLNGSSSHPVLKWYINLVPALKPFLHVCPYEGDFALLNLNLDMNMLISAFPGGTYLTLVKFFDKYDDNIFTIKSAHEYVSRDRVQF